MRSVNFAVPLIENQLVPDITKATGWVRSDTGKTLWMRTHTGKVCSANPKKAKSLMLKCRKSINEETPLLMITVNNDKSKPDVLLPPVLESVQFVSKNNCPSCVNFKGSQSDAVRILTYNDEKSFIDNLWMNLNRSIKLLDSTNNQVSRVFVNANKQNNLKKSLLIILMSQIVFV